MKLAGTEGAGRLFWSPDNRSIGFFADGRLKRVDAEGGQPQNIADTPDLLGGSWNEDGEILFASSEGLRRVLAAGGAPASVPVSIDGDDGRDVREPYFLPDGRRFLFLAAAVSGDGSDGTGSAIYVASLDSPEATHLVSAQSNPVYAEPGWLLYHRDGTLYGQAFDAGSLALEGEPIRLADDLSGGAVGAAAFSASDTGILAYRNEPDLSLAVPAGASAGAVGGVGNPPPLMWVTRAGRSEPASEPGRWIGVDLSPDGQRAAVHRHPDGAAGGDIWIFDEGQQTPSRFTFDDTEDNGMPVWSPDGTRIAFGSRRGGSWGLYLKLADNTRNEDRLIESEGPVMPMSWSPDGTTLVYWATDPSTQGDIWSISVPPDGNASVGELEPVPVLRTPADERNPQVSPDGRWLAYSSNETGRSEVYIRPFPEGPGRIQVSVNGGVYPRWRGDSQELYFLNLVSLGAVMTSELRVTGASIQREVPTRLFQGFFVKPSHAGVEHHAYAVSADGERFLIPQFTNVQEATANNAAPAIVASVMVDRRASSSAGNPGSPITVVLDWTSTATP